MVSHAGSSTLYSVHELCSPGRCMRILQPVEQWKSLQFQLQSWVLGVCWWELCPGAGFPPVARADVIQK